MRRIVVLFGILLALASLIPQSTTAQEASLVPARIRVMHASPDIGLVDMFVDGVRTFENISFFSTTEYMNLAAGQHRIQIAPAGKKAGKAVIDTTVDLIRGRPYTLAMMNIREESEGLLLSDSTKESETGMARVRFVHAAPNNQAVDLWMRNAQVPLLTDQYFMSDDYVELPAGSYTFDIANAGTSNVLLQSQSLRFEAGWTYTIAFGGMGLGNTPGPMLHTVIDRVGP